MTHRRLFTFAALTTSMGLVAAIGTADAAPIKKLPPPAPPTCPSPTCVDLRTVGASGTANGAIYTQIDPQPTGTGVIKPFLRLQGLGNTPAPQEGFNTSGRPFDMDQKNPLNWTHDLLLDDVPIVTQNGIDYRQFFLDINESNNGTNSLLSLDRLQIFQSNSGGAIHYSDLGTMIYDLDAGSNHYVLLEYDLGHGSGSGDMSVLIPNALFKDQDYVYLYSRFGDTWGSNAGFEEWWHGPATPVQTPEPATLALLVPALALGFGRRRRPVRS